MSKEIMQFMGKTVGTNMSKKELLEVIEFLASEWVQLQTERKDFEEVIYTEKIKRLKLAPNHKQSKVEE